MLILYLLIFQADILEKTEPTKAAASSSVEADSVVNHYRLNGALPRNLKADIKSSDTEALPIKDTKPTSSDARPIMMKVDKAEPIWLSEYKPTSLIDNLDPVVTDDGTNTISNVESAQVTDQHEVETELTPLSVSESVMISSQAELMNYTSVTEEIPKTNRESTENIKTVPWAIGANVFYGRMVSGPERYNMTSDEYYNQIYPTHHCDVFLIGKVLKVADTPHNRMVFAKFSDEETDSTSDDSTEKDITK